ncbi:tetratricopeptide repeat protein [Microbacterium sp. RD1]|uniref:tetratricopeptide repeat protein n=1 Tax=Microbacterium sp. RD1 TaxID=3457313 RepID=UPI003FA57645
MTDTWSARIAAVWDDPALSDSGRIAAIDALAAERGPEDAVALYERAGARDSAGEEAEAEPLYRAAIRAGLPDELRTPATIQLASTLRNLGRTAEALAMLTAEADRVRGTEWSDAVAAFLALALVSAGRPETAVAIALQALAPHLPRYTRSVAAYAQEIADRHA